VRSVRRPCNDAGHFTGGIPFQPYFRGVKHCSRSLFPLALCVGGLLALFGGPRSQAQGYTAGLSPGLNAALVRLLGDHQAFTARLRIRMTDGQGKETLDAPMQFALLDGKMRGELDITKMKSRDLPALAATAAKSVGMEKVVTLVRPDRQETYLLYPAFQSCLVAPLEAEDVAALKKPAQIRREPLARETIDGHPCVKSRVTVTEPNGLPHEALVWHAADLQEFPLRIQTVDGTDTLVMQFSRIRFERPAPKDFDLPAGTSRYPDAQSLSQAVMQRCLRQAITGP